jgi:GT2 family glycosyltransferase
MPTIAVLLPCYNPGTELVGTLDSLRAQSLPYTLFLVDDGSKTATDYEMLCRDIDAKIIRLPKNVGISGAMNAGLQHILAGSYDYVARIDAGDFCAPERFAKQISFMEYHPEIGILGSAVEFRLFDKNSALVGTRVVTFPLNAEEASKRLFLNSSIIHPAMMIRRNVYAALEAYSEEYPAAEDFDLLWRAEKLGFKGMNLPETLLIKEETPGSISHKRRRKQIMSRMRIQWANRNLRKLVCWYGLFKSFVTWALPSWAVTTLKFMRPAN